MAEIISGSVESIIYANAENGYSVFSIVDEAGEEIVCTGSVPYLNEGEVVKLQGKYIVHPVYGRQYQVAAYDKSIPTSVDGMEKYLASGVIKGIGKRMAARIVERFGEATFEVIESYPEKLAQINGITLKKALEFSAVFHEEAGQRQAMILLQGYGISTGVATKVYKHYKDRTVDIVKQNPYALAETIDGVGFKTVDSIAYRMGMDAVNPFRIKSGIRHILQGAVGSGHVYLPREVLIDKTARLLGVDRELVAVGLMELQVEKSLYVENLPDGPGVYLNSNYYAEMFVAKRLLELNQHRDDRLKVDEGDIDRVCESLGIQLASKQRRAVREALKGGVLVVTGGPGTGKTTAINTIITILKEADYEIELAAPTGRAAKRMTEATGEEAKTIHRLLEVRFMAEDSRRQSFERDENNPIAADVVIIDEISMVDIMLMYHLLKAIEPGTGLVLVGDADQLPSVGPGNVLKSIISSQKVPVVYLDEIFRQAKISQIVVNAHNINKGIYPEFNGEGSDFFMVKRANVDQVAEAIIELAAKRLPKFGGYDSIRDIQVLSPMRKSKIGVLNLNRELQGVLNPSGGNKKEHEYRDFIFREGDKVMQMKNNYNIPWEMSGAFGEEGQGIFNGDEGIIVEISPAREKLLVVFDDGKRVAYDFTQLDELELAYAITVHKSQGSEYKTVIIPVHSGPQMLLNRNILYTAVTRAREMVVLVGTESCLRQMVDNNREIERYSALDLKMAKFSEIYHG